MITRNRIRKTIDEVIAKREDDSKTNIFYNNAMIKLNDKFISELNGLKRRLCAL